MSEEGTGKASGGFQPAAGGHSSHLPPPPPPFNYYYGTFQGVANYQPQPPPQSHPVMGFPQPVPPPGLYAPPPHYYPHGYQTAPGYAVINVRPIREARLPCCGLGIGWCLFIVGFFMSAIPWYIGAFLLACVRLDYREKPGLIACAIAALLATVAVTFGVTRATHSW
ncbi:60S ribosomal protein L18a-like protein [Andrographis paniculata]|uniref:60S ribosomal protein L18a-like protein n=1 Tax=Andrographis paniculata TaxID=175694 RepID=UPI0021E6F003|nr:60S ribosomal protein L18a-like protein [Andrographis paniculata]